MPPPIMTIFRCLGITTILLTKESDIRLLCHQFICAKYVQEARRQAV
jgi:hypothetical protein